jgi:adenylate kinase family enzyme
VREYFEYKAGEEIVKIEKFFKKNTFVAYVLGKKGSGKGTHCKLFTDNFDRDKIAHLSVGDIVRAVDEEIKDSQKRKELVEFLKRNYRGHYSLEEIIKSQETRGVNKLLPTEYILVLLKREIDRLGRKALFIDGLPRTLDQVSYSLFFRELIGYRDDPDMFVLFQVPESIIEARIKFRVVCPKCQVPRNTKVLVTKEADYDEKEKKFYLLCDNPKCHKARMVPKEGGDLGIEAIKERLVTDGQLIEQAFSLYGVPKVLLRNSVPTSLTAQTTDDYELTPGYSLEWDQKKRKVLIKQEPWVVKDDDGVDSYSLLPHPIVVAMIKQVADVLDL